MVIKENLIVIIQARYNSARFPGKILKKINNKTLLEILIRRLRKSKYINTIVVAASKNCMDLKIKDVCIKLNIKFYAGSENDVLDRFYKISKLLKEKNIIIITSD